MVYEETLGWCMRRGFEFVGGFGRGRTVRWFYGVRNYSVIRKKY